MLTELKKTWGFPEPDSRLASEIKKTKGFSRHEFLAWYLTSVRRGEIQQPRWRWALTDLQKLGDDPLESVGSDADRDDVAAALKEYAARVTEHKIRHAESKAIAGRGVAAISSLLLPDGSCRPELLAKVAPIVRVLSSRQLPSQQTSVNCQDPRGCQEDWLRELNLHVRSTRFSLADQMPDAKRKELEIKSAHAGKLPPPEVLAVAIIASDTL